MNKQKKISVVAAVAAATAAMASVAVVGASSANAALTTRCVGEGGPVTVSGDLVVPAGKTCVLNGTTVTGDVTVARDADLIASSVTFEGRLRVRANAWADLVDSTVAGRVAVVDAAGFYGERSQLGEHLVVRRTDPTKSSIALTYDVEIAGNVTAREGEVSLEATTVDGNVVGRQAVYVDVLDSQVQGRLRVLDAPDGSLVCDSEIYGDSRFDGNQFIVQLGGPGVFTTCKGANYWGGDVVIANNAADVSLHDNIVRGDLGGDGNDPVPAGTGNRVRGETTGQFADLAPLELVAPELQSRTTTIAGDRREQLEQAAEQRTNQAIAEADNTGPADLAPARG